MHEGNDVNNLYTESNETGIVLKNEPVGGGFIMR